MRRTQAKAKPPAKIPSISEEQAPVFLKALAKTGVISEAARIAGISRVAAWRLRQKDPEFAKAWEDAFEQAIDALENEARNRALAKSDTLLIFLLKGHRPNIFREIHQIEGGTVPLKIEVVKFTDGTDGQDTK